MVNALLKAEDVAAILGIAAKTVHKLAREGKMAFVSVNGRDRRFTLQHVEDYIQRNTVNVPVDAKPQRRVSCAPKGEKKSVGANGTGLLREDIRKLWQ